MSGSSNISQLHMHLLVQFEVDHDFAVLEKTCKTCIMDQDGEVKENWITRPLHNHT